MPDHPKPKNLIPCDRCCKPIKLVKGYPNICDECYSICGSCCNEWEEDQNTEIGRQKSDDTKE
ncbi:MAG: hypothetical protein AAGB46_03270 [Verrucomicrobiota bacterium]